MEFTITGAAGIAALGKQLQLMQEASAFLGNATLIVGSELPYSRWIEYGSIPEWQRVRLAGAAQMAHIGLRAAVNHNQNEIARAVFRGAPTMKRALTMTVNMARNLAQVVTPVQSGALRGSLYGKLESR